MVFRTMRNVRISRAGVAKVRFIEDKQNPFAADNPFSDGQYKVISRGLFGKT